MPISNAVRHFRSCWTGWKPRLEIRLTSRLLNLRFQQFDCLMVFNYKLQLIFELISKFVWKFILPPRTLRTDPPIVINDLIVTIWKSLELAVVVCAPLKSIWTHMPLSANALDTNGNRILCKQSESLLSKQINRIQTVLRTKRVLVAKSICPAIAPGIDRPKEQLEVFSVNRIED